MSMKTNAVLTHLGLLLCSSPELRMCYWVGISDTKTTTILQLQRAVDWK